MIGACLEFTEQSRFWEQAIWIIEEKKAGKQQSNVSFQEIFVTNLVLMN